MTGAYRTSNGEWVPVVPKHDPERRERARLARWLSSQGYHGKYHADSQPVTRTPQYRIWRVE